MPASLVAIPFLGALLPPLFNSRLRLDPALAAMLVAGTALACLATLTAAPFNGETLIVTWQWLPSIGLELAFRFDGLGMLFAYLIVGIGLLVIVYARYYRKAEDATGRFYSFLLLFMGSMLGVVLSENLLLLLVFWELTSLVSFLLIGYWKHDQEARLRSATKMSLPLGSKRFDLDTNVRSGQVRDSRSWGGARLGAGRPKVPK